MGPSKLGRRKLCKGEASSSTVTTVVFVISVLLILFAVWAVARQSRNAAKRFGLWATSLERTRNFGKYLYFFALLLLVVRAFKGIGGVLKLLATVVYVPCVLAGRKLRESLNLNRRFDQNVDGLSPGGSARDIPLLGRLVFIFVEKRSREHLVGDLEEEYWALILPVRGRFRARSWWWGEALRILTAYLWKRIRRLLDVAAVRGLRRR